MQLRLHEEYHAEVELFLGSSGRDLQYLRKHGKMFKYT
jgi:hypothetical protein